ncbi:MAG: type VI secretion system baseplate subunit TssG [Proteobacteria bacterium]|nr:type VI secretion system baseplate subunit TssG [Pseudomonadota bacterium]
MTAAHDADAADVPPLDGDALDARLDVVARHAATLAFPEAVRLLCRALGTTRPVGTTGRIDEEAVLFRAAPSMGFPAGDIAAVARDRRPGAAWPVQMEVNFLGLYGPSSPLPSPWTEHVLTEDEPRAANLRDVLDLFNHPLVALSYRIWRHYRMHLRAESPADPVVRAVLALAGLTPRDGWTDTALDPFRLLPLCGLLAQYSRSAEIVARIIKGYFDVPVRIEEWRPRRAPIPPPQLFRLGAPGAALGAGSVIGETVPDVCGMIAVVLGPLSGADFDAFLPGGHARRSLAALLHLAIREPLECMVELILAPEADGGLTLGSARLGWTSWQGGEGAERRCLTGPA